MDFIEAIERAAEGADRSVRYHEIVKEGDVIPQGDVYLRRIASESDEDRRALEREIRAFWPDFRLGPLGPETRQRQLVQGNTIGSRHEIDAPDMAHVTLYAPSSEAGPLEGPVIVAHGRFLLVHPEHASHSIPEGVYQVTHQRDHALEMARIAD